MVFYVVDDPNYELAENCLIDTDEPEPLKAGTRIKLVFDKDHSQMATVDEVGHPTTGDGKRLDDLVANITVNGGRYGLIYTGTGPLRQRWAVVGGPYDEALVE